MNCDITRALFSRMEREEPSCEVQQFGHTTYWYAGQKCFRMGDGSIIQAFTQDMNELKYTYPAVVSCPKCKETANLTEDKVDPCLGYLPGVDNACCGHGTGEGYIQFKNGVTIRGSFAVEWD